MVLRIIRHERKTRHSLFVTDSIDAVALGSEVDEKCTDINKASSAK